MTSWISDQEPQFLEQFLFASIKVALDSEDTGKESGPPALVTLSLRSLNWY